MPIEGVLSEEEFLLLGAPVVHLEGKKITSFKESYCGRQ